MSSAFRRSVDLMLDVTRRILASLRDRHLGPPMMGSGGCGGPIYRGVLAIRLTAGIRTRNGLASSIVLLSLRWTFRAKRACVVITEAEPDRLAPLTPVLTNARVLRGRPLGLPETPLRKRCSIGGFRAMRRFTRLMTPRHSPLSTVGVGSEPSHLERTTG